MYCQENNEVCKIFCASRLILLYSENTNGQERLRRSQPLEGSNPNAHNIPPLERASGYGNTAGTILPSGVALRRVAPRGTHLFYQCLRWFPNEK